jgi:hypothetical protein
MVSNTICFRGSCYIDPVLIRFISTYEIISIALKVVMLITAHHKVYSIQSHAIVCQWLVADLWFSPGIPISTTNTINLSI